MPDENHEAQPNQWVGCKRHTVLVGGFNPSEKYYSNFFTSPGRVENKKQLKPPSRVTYRDTGG